MEQVNWEIIYDENKKALVVDIDSYIDKVDLNYKFNLMVPISQSFS